MEHALPSRPRSDRSYVNPNLPLNLPPRGHKRARSSISSAATTGSRHCAAPPEKKQKHDKLVAIKMREQELLATRMSISKAVLAGGPKRKTSEGGDGDIVVGDDGAIKLEKRRKRHSGSGIKTSTPTHSAPGKHPWDPSPRVWKQSTSATYHLPENKGTKYYDGEKMRGWMEESENESSNDRLMSPFSTWLTSQFLVDCKDKAIQTEPEYRPSQGYGSVSVSLDFHEPSIFKALKRVFQQTIKTHVIAPSKNTKPSKSNQGPKEEEPTVAMLSAKIDRILQEAKGTSNVVGGFIEELRRGLYEVRETVVDIKANQLREALMKTKRVASVNEPAVECDSDKSWVCFGE